MKYVLDNNLEVLGEEDDIVIGNPLLALIPGIASAFTGGGGGGGSKDGDKKPGLTEEQIRKLVAEERARQEAEARAKRNQTLLIVVGSLFGAGIIGLGTYVALKK